MTAQLDRGDAERITIELPGRRIAALRSGPVLRVQTHPSQRFAIGDSVAIEIDGGACTAFRLK